jgi:hypothetical protein
MHKHVAREVRSSNQRVQEDRQMPKQERPDDIRNVLKDTTIRDTLKDTIIASGGAASRSGKGGKSGGGLGGQQAGGIKGGGKRKTHVGYKKGSPGGLTSD